MSEEPKVFVDVDFQRQLDFFRPTEHPIDATIIGAGGIGSFTALALGKLGVRSMSLWDSDTVEMHNLPNQLFGRSAIGKPKVEAVQAILKELAFVKETKVVNGKFPPNGKRSPISSNMVISAVDRMDSRKAIWELGVRKNPSIRLFVDGRIGGEEIRILSMTDVMNKVGIERYEATITSDHDTVPLTCTGQAVIDVGFLVASVIVKLARKAFVGKKVPFETLINVANTFQVFEFE